MNILSLLNHVHARTASPLEVPAAQAQSKTSAVIHQAASSSGTNGSSGSDAASGSSAAITANDFLTLLVTEIQNQDPTSQTDPMTYITQLVGVNSLQQLLQINQTLTTAAGPGGPLAGGGATAPATGQSRASNSPVANSTASSAAIQGSQLTTGGASIAGARLLPLSASGPATVASTNAVAQAFTHPVVMPSQVAPPTQVPLNPEVLRALEHSIPGAKLVGPSSGVQ